MNHADALEVLAAAAAFDRRTVGEADGMAWSLALPGINIQEAKSAVIQHYTRTDAWVMPSHILAIVAEVNRERARDLPPVTPPRDLADEPHREVEWKRIWGDAVIAGHTEDKARDIANLQLGVSDDELLAIGAGPVGTLRETLDRTTREIAAHERLVQITAELERQAKVKRRDEQAEAEKIRHETQAPDTTPTEETV